MESLPALALGAGSFPDEGHYRAIGDRWAQETFSGYHYDVPVYVDRVTGEQRLSVRPAFDTVEDLDRPGLTRTLCAGERRPRTPDDNGSAGFVPGPLAIDGRRAAALTYAVVGTTFVSRIVLEACGRRPTTVRVCAGRVTCSDPVINDRVVAWVENRSRLVVRSLGSGRTRAVAAPAPLTLLAVGPRLYVTSDGRLLRVAL